MKFLEIRTLSCNSEVMKLGLKPKEDDFFEVTTYINLDQITYLKENPDDSNSTLIICNNGSILTTTIKLENLVTALSSMTY